MAVVSLRIEQFINEYRHCPVIDVRSEGEYLHAHIPNAFSMPLFNNEERKIVGTTYKQQSREDAIKVGLDIFGGKMRKMVEEVEQLFAGLNNTITMPGDDANGNITAGKKTVVVHCWRGGMRSAGVAWLLDLYGFKVYTITGGYKAFRNWVLQQFSKSYPFKILGGYTGSGKTPTLKQLNVAGEVVIDLEGLANHKGSAFGRMGMPPQPTQEMFENALATALSLANNTINQRVSTAAEPNTNNGVSPAAAIWLEDESQRIGNLNIHPALWKTMRAAPVCFLEIPFEKRLRHIVEGYGKSPKEELINSIIRIKKRLGGLETKEAVNFLLEDNIEDCFRILLRYYDKLYTKALGNRDPENPVIEKIICADVQPVINAEKIITYKHD